MEKKLQEVINRLDALKQEMAALEQMVEELTAAQAGSVPVEEPADLSDPIDLSLDEVELTAVEAPAAVTAEAVAAEVPAVDPSVEVAVAEVEDILVDIDLEEAVEVEPVAVSELVVDEEPVVEPEVVAEAEPVAVSEPVVEEAPVFEPVAEEDLVVESVPVAAEEPVATPEPVAEPVAASTSEEDEEDGYFGLFGEEVPAESKGDRRNRRRREVSEMSTGNKAVIDAMSVGAAWRTDIPGPEVKSLRSAIALGDQVMFIARLFRKDSALYQDTVDRLNRTNTLSEAIGYLSETFPEWDLASDDVYKFMMAVRRKIRK